MAAGSKMSGRERVSLLLSSQGQPPSGDEIKRLINYCLRYPHRPYPDLPSCLVLYQRLPPLLSFSPPFALTRRQEWDAVLELVAAEESRSLPLSAAMLDLAIALMGRAGRTQEASQLAATMQDR